MYTAIWIKVVAANVRCNFAAPPPTFHHTPSYHPMSCPTSSSSPSTSKAEENPYQKVINGCLLGLRYDEFLLRVKLLTRILEDHYRHRKRLSGPEYGMTLDTAAVFLLRWIPDCWIVAVEFGQKCEPIFKRLLSSAFFMRKLFRYFRR